MLTRKDFERFLVKVKNYLPDCYRVLHYTQKYDESIREDMERQIVNTVLVIQL